MDVKEWREAFQKTIENLPRYDTVLTTVDSQLVRLRLDFVPDKTPFVYGIAYVPTLVGTEPKWYARSLDDKLDSGWRVILLPKSRDHVLKRFGVMKDVIGVKSLRIIKKTENGRCLLGEVAEWE